MDPLNRYTDDLLMKMPNATETEVVKAVYPECPTSEKDRERSAVRTARLNLLSRMLQQKPEPKPFKQALVLLTFNWFTWFVFWVLGVADPIRHAIQILEES